MFQIGAMPFVFPVHHSVSVGGHPDPRVGPFAANPPNAAADPVERRASRPLRHAQSPTPNRRGRLLHVRSLGAEGSGTVPGRAVRERPKTGRCSPKETQPWLVELVALS